MTIRSGIGTLLIVIRGDRPADPLDVLADRVLQRVTSVPINLGTVFDGRGDAGFIVEVIRRGEPFVVERCLGVCVLVVVVREIELLNDRLRDVSGLTDLDQPSPPRGRRYGQHLRTPASRSSSSCRPHPMRASSRPIGPIGATAARHIEQFLKERQLHALGDRPAPIVGLGLDLDQTTLREGVRPRRLGLRRRAVHTLEDGVIVAGLQPAVPVVLRQLVPLASDHSAAVYPGLERI